MEVVEDEDIAKVKAYLSCLSSTGKSASENYKNARLQVIWRLFYFDGLRVSELAKIDLQDINRIDQNDEIVSVYINGKGQRNREVWLHPETVKALFDYLKVRKLYIDSKRNAVDLGAEALFISAKGNRISIRQVERLVNRLNEVAGTEEKLSCHKLRRTAVSQTVNNLENLADLPVIAESFGHGIRILQTHYLKVKPEMVLKAKMGFRKAA